MPRTRPAVSANPPFLMPGDSLQHTYTIRPFGKLVLTVLATSAVVADSPNAEGLRPVNIRVELDAPWLSTYLPGDLVAAVDAAARAGYFNSCLDSHKATPASASAVAALVGAKLNALLGMSAFRLGDPF